MKKTSLCKFFLAWKHDSKDEPQSSGKLVLVQEPCVGYVGTRVWKKTYTALLKNLHFSWLHTVLTHTSVIFTSLCYLWAMSWQWRTPEHLPLHTSISTSGGWGGLWITIVTSEREIPSARGQGWAVCALWVSNMIYHPSHALSFSHCLKGHPVFMNGLGCKHLANMWSPSLSATTNTLPATYSKSNLFTSSASGTSLCHLASLQSMCFFNVAFLFLITLQQSR